MPQIWLTYREFAALAGCDPAEARKASIAAGLDRRKSRDGETRIKLTPQFAAEFLDTLVQQLLDRKLAQCANDLRALGELAQDRSRAAPGSPSHRVLRGPAAGGTFAA